MPRDVTEDPRSLLPPWHARERPLAHMLPYVSLVDDHTVRTRANELFQCIRLGGVNSQTTDDGHLDKITALFVIDGGKPVGLLHVHDCLASGVI